MSPTRREEDSTAAGFVATGSHGVTAQGPTTLVAGRSTYNIGPPAESNEASHAFLVPKTPTKGTTYIVPLPPTKGTVDDTKPFDENLRVLVHSQQMTNMAKHNYDADPSEENRAVLAERWRKEKRRRERCFAIVEEKEREIAEKLQLEFTLPLPVNAVVPAPPGPVLVFSQGQLSNTNDHAVASLSDAIGGLHVG